MTDVGERKGSSFGRGTTIIPAYDCYPEPKGGIFLFPCSRPLRGQEQGMGDGEKRGQAGIGIKPSRGRRPTPPGSAPDPDWV